MDSLYLVHNGVPFDVAFSLPPHERLHWVVVIGRHKTGFVFDWTTKEWSEN